MDEQQRSDVPLRRILDELGWSAEQLVARTNQVRARRGVSPLNAKAAYPWRRGGRPAPDVMGDVLTALTRHGRTSVTAADLGWASARSRRLSPLARPYDASATALLRDTKGAPMHRRTFVLLTGAAVTGTALDLMVASAGPLQAALDGDRVTPALVSEIEESIRRARALDDTEGSTPALTWADGLWQTLGDVLTEGQYRTPEAIRLHTAYIEASETYGWMLFDAGKYPQAQRVYSTGMRVARVAESHPDVDRATANLLASAAYLETWIGQHSEAETMLAVARSRAPQSLTPRVLAVIADREITLAGRRGDSERLRRAQDSAHTDLDAAASDDPWWSVWLSHRGVDSTTGRAWFAANRPEHAEPYILGGFTPGLPAHRRDQAVFASEWAHTYLRTGDVTNACTATGEALSLIEPIDSPRVRNRLNAAVATLRRQHGNHPSVRALFAA